MQRKSSRLLALGAILGVSATAALVVLLLRGGGPHARDSRGGVPTETPATEAGGAGAPGSSSVPGQRSGGGTGLRVASGDGRRTPYDSPETVLETARKSSRITEILNEIRTLDDLHIDERRKLFTELQTLIRTLGRRVDRATRDELLRMLTSVEGKWRPLVGEALGYLEGDVESARSLMGMLKERPSNVYTRSAILTALGMMRVQEVLPELVATLGEGYDSEPLIVRAIGQIGGTEASRALLAQLGRPLERGTALEIERVLGQAADPNVMAEIKERLKDAPPKSRASMLDILALTGDAAHAPAVRELLLHETDAEARRSAIEALGRFGDPASGEVILRILETGSEDERQTAARAMQRVRNPETVEGLAAAYAGMGESARAAVLLAGARLSTPGPKLLEAAKEGILDPAERIRTASVRILGQRGRDEHVDPLADYLKRASNLRETSAGFQALRQVGTRRAAEVALSLIDRLPERQREAQRTHFEKLLGEK